MVTQGIAGGVVVLMVCLFTSLRTATSIVKDDFRMYVSERFIQCLSWNIAHIMILFAAFLGINGYVDIHPAIIGSTWIITLGMICTCGVILLRITRRSGDGAWTIRTLTVILALVPNALMWVEFVRIFKI